MSARRTRWSHAVARLAVVGALAAGAVLGADRLGSVSSGTAAQQAAPRVAATSSTTFCPGDPFGAGTNPDSAVEATGAVSAHAAPPEALEGVIAPVTAPGKVTLSDLSGPPSTADKKPTSGSPTASDDSLGDPVMARGTEEHAPGFVAGETLVAGGRVSGLAALPCTTPTADAWLVAGGGGKGREERVVLTNPGGNPLTATVETLGSQGERSVVVPPQDRRVVELDPVGGASDPQAVHVTSAGGLVVPTITDRHLEGRTSGGVETVSATAPPTTRQVVPASAGDSGLAIGVQGDREAKVEIRRAGARSGTRSTVAAGEVADVELPKGKDVHSWIVESDEPVVAAAHQRSVGGGGDSDVAWSVATPAIGTLGGAALPQSVPKGVTGTLDITAGTQTADADVLVQSKGTVTTTRVSLEPGDGRSVPLGAAEAVWVRPTKGQVHSAVLLSGRDRKGRPQATSIPVLPTRVATRDIEVVHQR